MGLTADLVLDWLKVMSSFYSSSDLTSTFQVAKDDPSSEPGAALMLKQLVILLTECSVVAWESIARLGSSCFRHLLSVASTQLQPAQLEVCRHAALFLLHNPVFMLYLFLC